MKQKLLYFLLALLFSCGISGQSDFDYSLSLVPVDVPDFSGLHSYAFGQHNGKWLLIGGRSEGIHARQPWASFPAQANNTDLLVIDVVSLETWSASVNTLSIGLREQLQSTNMNFFQDVDTLYLIGGYAYAESAGDHITFPDLTTVEVSGLINAIINDEPIQGFFKQTSDEVFAVTGGQLGKIDDTFYLVGGQRFDGRYNPMNNPTFIQEYTNQIRKFTIDNSGSSPVFSHYEAITDPVHLRRRDYNLLPQVFEDGTLGYTISSGVFQLNFDLPFLYPVEIRKDGYTPITSFNQYLSNYHGAKVSLHDSQQNQMHSLFFGGISQYYYEGDEMMQDDLVPFVQTISRLTRLSNGTWHEFRFPFDMPFFQGASAEFIPNRELPHFPNEVIKLSEIKADTILLGHVVGGIFSSSANPFSFNQTGETEADYSIFEVWLIRDSATGVFPVNGQNPYEVEVFPQPAKDQVNIRYELPSPVSTEYFITNTDGRIIKKGFFTNQAAGNNLQTLPLEGNPGLYFITLIFEHRFFVTKKILKQ
ncbi:MAG: T9SS type A sorting domain-containing protein [Bacteroides sp.]|jgi:hypothetical protein|nr:T9SS type A sorting domain-containing protein [Bacteroides sp.]